MVLSRMLEAINESKLSGRALAVTEMKEISLLGESFLCLLDILSDERPTFHRLGSWPDSSARVELLSQASKSIVVDLDAYLNVEVLQFSFAASNAEGVEVWGLDNSGDKTVAVIKVDAQAEDKMNCLRLDAVFPSCSMLRYLVITCPEGVLSTLLDFDVRGKSFVFS